MNLSLVVAGNFFRLTEAQATVQLPFIGHRKLRTFTLLSKTPQPLSCGAHQLSDQRELSWADFTKAEAVKWIWPAGCRFHS